MIETRKIIYDFRVIFNTARFRCFSVEHCLVKPERQVIYYFTIFLKFFSELYRQPLLLSEKGILADFSDQIPRFLESFKISFHVRSQLILRRRVICNGSLSQLLWVFLFCFCFSILCLTSIYNIYNIRNSNINLNLYTNKNRRILQSKVH